MITKRPAYLQGVQRKPAAGAIVPAAEPTTMLVKIPHTAQEAASRQGVAEEERDAVLTITELDSLEAYAAADEMLTHFAQDKDAAIKMRQTVTGPLKQAAKTVEAWFKPWVDARDESEKHVKKLMADFQTQRAHAEAEARALAVAAASSGDADGMIEALTAAQEIGDAKAGGATVRYEWVVETIDPELLPRAYWIPDLRVLQGVAKSAGSGETPPEEIPGVTFKRQAAIAAKRK